MAWIYLVLAIIAEVLGTTAMKLSLGFNKLAPSIAMLLFYLLSLSFLTLALKKIEVSIAYAIWSGLGTTLITLIGIFYFKEHLDVIKLLGIALIIIGVVLLQLKGASGV